MPDAPRTVFLDRDGVINRKAPEGEYITSPDQFELLPGALEGIRALTQARCVLVVVTNQRGIALGRMTEADLAAIHVRMLARVAEVGGRIAAVYHCPHDERECDCRKPGTGMFEAAAREVEGVMLAGSAVIGDHARDIEAARRIGATAVFVGAGPAPAGADHVARDLAGAARWLLSQPSSSTSRRSSSS